MPRGTDFTARWNEGMWAEERIIEAINREEKIFAVQYGITDGEAFRSIVDMNARTFPNQTLNGKRPDILIFCEDDLDPNEKEIALSIYKLEDADCASVIAKAGMAIESEFSPYDYAFRIENYGKELSFTVKEEDLMPTEKWKKTFGVEVSIVQVFFDSAYMLPLSHLRGWIDDGTVKRKIEGAYNKPVYYTPISRGIEFGDFVEKPNLAADLIRDQYGKYTSYRKTAGGVLSMRPDAVEFLRGGGS